MTKVQVRIAVAVDANGKWNCCGASGMDDQDMLDLARDCVDPGDVCYWLTAELDLPEVKEVPAVVSDPVRQD